LHMNRLAALAAGVLIVTASAHAQPPAQTPAPATSAGKITRILVGFPPGQATDLVARLVAERLTAALGHSVIVENRPGQGGSIVLAQLAKSPADGSVITLSALAAYSVNPYLYKSAGYDTLRDFDPMVLVTHPSVPVSGVRELIDYVKANPEKLSHFSSGNGTLSHLLMEDFKQRAGIRILHVPYQGSPRAITDAIAGIVQVGLDTVTVTGPQIKAGRLKMIAAGTANRLAAFAQTPTIAESGFPGFEAVAWIGLAAPARTPREWRERVAGEVLVMLREPAFVERFSSIGAVPRPLGVDEFGNHLRAEQKRWKDVVERSGVKVD
jgi:tripartite-type tricarboxylate transporter receptor subunit TctC